jgi:hypothetical protein
MSGYYDFLKIQYELGNLTKERLRAAVTKGYLTVNETVDEYKQITSEDYTS